MAAELSARRVGYLDGVRGVAALVVVVHHFILGFGPGDRRLDALFNGYTAVLIFFVLSGFVMSASSAKTDLGLRFRCITRYLRLALPMLPVMAISWALLALLPTASRDLGELVSSTWSSGTFSKGAPPIWQIVTDAMVKPFISGSIYLDNSTGTMGPELIGSILVFGLIRFCGSRWRPAILICTAALCLGVYGNWEFQRDALFCFATGALIWHFRLAIDRMPDFVSLPVALLSLLVLAITAYGVSVPIDGVYSFGPNGVVRLAAVTMLIGAIVGSRRLQGLFGSRPLVFLGRVSFGMYLIHQPLESTVIARLYTGMQPSGIWVGVFAVSFFAASFLAGWVVTLALDEPVVFALKAWSRRPTSRSRHLIGDVSMPVPTAK